MAWIADQYYKLSPPILMQRPCHRQTGVDGESHWHRGDWPGIQYALREFFRDSDIIARAGLSDSLEGKRILVQGLGNVGYHAAKFAVIKMARSSPRLRDGVVTAESGIDVDALRSWIQENGGVSDFTGRKL